MKVTRVRYLPSQTRRRLLCADTRMELACWNTDGVNVTLDFFVEHPTEAMRLELSRDEATKLIKQLQGFLDETKLEFKGVPGEG